MRIRFSLQLFSDEIRQICCISNCTDYVPWLNNHTEVGLRLWRSNVHVINTQIPLLFFFRNVPMKWDCAKLVWKTKWKTGSLKHFPPVNQISREMTSQLVTSQDGGRRQKYQRRNLLDRFADQPAASIIFWYSCPGMVGYFGHTTLVHPERNLSIWGWANRGSLTRCLQENNFSVFREGLQSVALFGKLVCKDTFRGVRCIAVTPEGKHANDFCTSI